VEFERKRVRSKRLEEKLIQKHQGAITFSHGSCIDEVLFLKILIGVAGEKTKGELYELQNWPSIIRNGIKLKIKIAD